jgi:hypothetical protein
VLKGDKRALFTADYWRPEGIVRPLGILCFVFALMCGIAEAAETGPGFVNGNDLYAYCTASDNSKRGICLSYVEGMAESIGLMQTASAAAVFCIPPVLASQARDMVVKYLQDNPAHRHEAGATLVMEALHDAWPCR